MTGPDKPLPLLKVRPRDLAAHALVVASLHGVRLVAFSHPTAT